MRCWYTRWRMSNALDRGDLASRMARGHAARCAACQTFGAALESLHGRLSLGAHDAPAPVIVERHARWPVLVGGPLAVGAAAIAIAIAVGGEPVSPTADPPPSPPASLPGMERVATLVAQVLASTPLDRELDHLLQDGRRGLDAVLATAGLGWVREPRSDGRRGP